MVSKSILLLDGHTAQALPLMRTFRKKGYHTTIFCNSKMSYGYGSRYPDKKVICPKFVDNPEKFTEIFYNYIKNNKIDIVIPLNDDSARFLSYNKKEVESYTGCLMPDYEIFMQGFDKIQLMELCQRLKLPHPNTANLEVLSSEAAVEITGFPAIIKPNITWGGRGMRMVNSLEELKELYPGIRENYGACHLQKYIKAGGGQYKVELFVDQDAIDISAVFQKLRYYPQTGGVSACMTSIENYNLVNIARKILKELKWVGFADIEFIGDPDDGIIKVMEMNPRFPASIRTATVSGIDFAEITTNYSLGIPLPDYKYEHGKYLRYLALDVLWFITSKNRFKAAPSWFKFLGRNVYYQDGSFRDPLPFLFGTLSSIRKILNPKFRKAKSGLS